MLRLGPLILGGLQLGLFANLCFRDLCLYSCLSLKFLVVLLAIRIWQSKGCGELVVEDR